MPNFITYVEAIKCYEDICCYMFTLEVVSSEQHDFAIYLAQGSVTYGPPRHFNRPATFYCHPARDLFSFFDDTYAPINRRKSFLRS